MPTLTAVTLPQYRPHATKRREVRDAGAPGLYLVIQPKPTGTRSWALRYRDSRGKSVKLALGPVDLTPDASLGNTEPVSGAGPQVGEALTLADARQLAATLNREKSRGVDLVARYAKSRRKADATKSEADSFRARAIEFVRTYKTKKQHETPRRWRGDARLLGLAWAVGADRIKVDPEVLPGSLADVWGHRPVGEISRREIEDVVEDARAKGVPGLGIRNADVSENRGRKLFSILSVFFGWAAKRRYIDSDPSAAIERPHAPKARSRSLTGAELRWLWLAADRLNPPYADVIHLLLSCGQRLVETSGMLWSELNEDASLWKIPPSRTKNHKEHVVPLPLMARGIIGGVPRIAGRDLVFSANGTTMATGFGHAKIALDAAMADVAKKERGHAMKLEPWVLHDLRRSFAGGLQHIGVAPQVIERALNHSSGTFSGGIVGVYQVDPLTNDVRTALSSWSRYLQLVVDKALFEAHEAHLLDGDDDERARNLAHFRDSILAGSERWQGYLDMLGGRQPPKLSDLSDERRRRRSK